MAPTPDLEAIALNLASQSNLTLQSLTIIQSLWAGYGQICSIQATSPDSSPISLILKCISPPSHARTTSEGHIRKLLSYRAEQHFYAHLAPSLPPSAAVAQCIGSINDGTTTALLLKDLTGDGFPVALEKRGKLTQTQVRAALRWLAAFHGHFWGRVGARDRETLIRPPLEEQRGELKGVWLNGGYTYLATRRTEFASLARDKGSEWSAVLCDAKEDGKCLAERVAEILAPRGGEYETLIHGDVKSENMFASRSGEQVAFVDFQYVGLGLGVCDLAKLFTCSVPVEMLAEEEGEEELDMQEGERGLLKEYVRMLEEMAGRTYPWDVFVKHWEAALVDWLRFQASWGFWGNTEWLEAKVRYIVRNSDI